MKLLIVIALVGLASSHPTYEEVTKNYHTTIGIPEAARIKATEEAAVESRIVGGTPASHSQFPWLGGLVITLSWGATSVCGSSLISDRVVITAAHCWFDGSNQAVRFEVVLGALTLFTGGTRRTTSNVITHENWDPARIKNDLALAHIEPIQFTDSIKAIRLPSNDYNKYTGSWAWAAGFGIQNDFSSISNNQVMHHVNIQIISNAVCQNTFGTYITSGNICTDSQNGQSPCRGDSGGPLSVGDGETKTLVGVVSFGTAAGCELGFPAAFVRVSHFLSWIKERM